MLKHSKCIEQGFNSLYSGRSIYSHPQDFRGDTPKKERTPNVESPKSSDVDKQIVYIRVIDPAESKFWPLWKT